MPEQDDNKIIDDNNAGAGGDEFTLTSAKEMIESQAALINEMKNENANSNAALRQAVEDKYGSMNSDIQNLSGLLGGLASGGETAGDVGGEEIDMSDPKVVADIARKAAKDLKDEDTQAEIKESQAYFNEYADEVRGLLDEETAPDGKPYSPSAREGILNLLKTTVTTIHSKNGIRDAHKNFKLANKAYYGLDKQHGFTGGSVTGAGGGTSTGVKAGGKKTYKLTDETKKMLSQLGTTEEWANKTLAKMEQ